VNGKFNREVIYNHILIPSVTFGDGPKAGLPLDPFRPAASRTIIVLQIVDVNNADAALDSHFSFIEAWPFFLPQGLGD
jgi:hypothetical protein